MASKQLGRQIDVLTGIQTIADLAGQANTGFRVNMKNYGSLIAVFYANAVSAGTDTFVVDWQQHTALTGGTSADLDVITEWFIKTETTLDGDEVWARVTQSVASEISMTGATYSATQVVMVSEITADQLSDGYTHASVDIADPGAGGTRVGGVLYIGTNLGVQRRLDLLAQPNAA